MGFAAKTSTPIENTKNEIEKTLIRYGVEQFGYMTSVEKGSAVAFVYHKMHFKIEVPHPSKQKFDTDTKWNQEHRRLWRVILLRIKANLEEVDCGHRKLEDIFLADLLLPSGLTVSQLLKPQINQMIESGQMPKGLLPAAEINHE
ncbi:MAG TPA: hypothetical protein DCP47_01420 [Phycisphaerales bacterium]|nr:hypothetical protein [Phycisphaerales bacterium]